MLYNTTKKNILSLSSEKKYLCRFFWNMIKLSVNINKIATLRNARGGDIPNVVQVAIDCQRFGADGITVHPRPDQRHITTKDLYELKKVITTEFNIEGYPDERYLQLIEKLRPQQATLVPDPPNVLTSNAGWQTKKNIDFLSDIAKQLKTWNVRSSVFVDTDIENIDFAKQAGFDRIELYTENYAKQYSFNSKRAIEQYIQAAKHAQKIGLYVNAGHDLNADNLNFFATQIPFIAEVSIGHALIADALYLGLENTIRRYKFLLNQRK